MFFPVLPSSFSILAVAVIFFVFFIKLLITEEFGSSAFNSSFKASISIPFFRAFSIKASIFIRSVS